MENYGEGARATGASAGELGPDEDDEDAESEENLRERLWSAIESRRREGQTVTGTAGVDDGIIVPSGPPGIAGVAGGIIGPSGPPDIAGVNAGSSGDFARLYEEDNIASPDLATLDGDIENINGRAMQGP